MALVELADEDLMQLVRKGDDHAFKLVYDRHCTAAFSLAYRMTGQRVAAEDVVQEAFLSLWRSGARYDRARGSVRTWVLGIVHNRAIDLFRRDSVRTSRDVSDEGAVERMSAPDSTEGEVHRREDASEVLDWFIRDLGMPRSLREVKVGPEHFETIAEQAMGTPWIPRNPRKIDGPAQVREILLLAA